MLLDRLDDQTTRNWCAEQAVQHGWSRHVLEHHIRTGAHQRLEAAPTNFAAVLPAGESDLAQQLTEDPYVLDFLALDGDAKERHLEQALVDRIIDTLRELGEGFAFVGRQVHFDVDGDDFYVDLMFFPVEQLRYVVIELIVEPPQQAPLELPSAHHGLIGLRERATLLDGTLTRTLDPDSTHTPPDGASTYSETGRAIRLTFSPALPMESELYARACHTLVWHALLVGG